MAKRAITAIDGPASDSGPIPVVFILDEIAADGGLRTDGDFSALAMLLIDSTINGNEDALRAVHGWLKGEYARASEPGDSADPEVRGQIKGLIDVSHWAGRRALPPLAGSDSNDERATADSVRITDLLDQRAQQQPDHVGYTFIDYDVDPGGFAKTPQPASDLGTRHPLQGSGYRDAADHPVPRGGRRAQ